MAQLRVEWELTETGQQMTELADRMADQAELNQGLPFVAFLMAMERAESRSEGFTRATVLFELREIAEQIHTYGTENA